ncbi:PREDICTED: uncharacterized protein LOC107187060 [Dufourea novaeangliae]|uniref:Uncharacterized protein n=1 Tax=Dufourea novaeangliae TaxID=178035 RepID=A0A154PC66_DUFNO|nr:PREDICTED: uncharacterized protein LOC107187060 [Dufourea novaeangliae]KZC08790.1 hypothetical protein WN55_11293 [Dufourea novaeangliae]
MSGASVLLLIAFLLVPCLTLNVLRRYESECRLQVGPGPCQRACELEKIGLTKDGKFNVTRAMGMVDQGGLELYPDNKRNLLKAALHVCHREIMPEQSLDNCSAASAVYYCVRGLLRPEKLYQKEIPYRSYGWKLLPCRCGKFRGYSGLNDISYQQ